MKHIRLTVRTPSARIQIDCIASSTAEAVCDAMAWAPANALITARVVR